MSNPFAITAATNSVRLDANRQGEASFTVFNASGRPIRGRAQITPQEPAAAGWLTLVGEAERNFAIAAAEQFTVRIAAPATAPAGDYPFRLDALGVENPDEEFTAGPTVTFVVPEPEPKRKFPWWILAVAAGVLIIAAAAFLFWRSSQGRQAASATATAEAATAIAQAAQAATATAQVMATQTALAQAATATARAQATRTAVANATGTAVAAVTQTAIAQQGSATQTAIAQMTATADVQATQTAVANATATAIATAINRYTGSWRVENGGPPYVTKVQITREEQTIKFVVTGSAFVNVLSGGVGSVLCTPECAWGEVSVPYTGDPLSFRITTHPRLFHQITVSVTPDGSTLTVVDQVFLDGANQFTNVYSLEKVSIFDRFTFPTGVLEVSPNFNFNPP